MKSLKDNEVCLILEDVEICLTSDVIEMSNIRRY